MRRRADQSLLEAIAGEQFAYVLAPRASGKSSLMGRAIRRLRADGQVAAVIDLAQIATRGDVDSARWHYSMAYRICRELRLKFDLQAWWQERSMLLNEQRLVEFFWDVVLANTSVPITIFFDEVERVVDLPFSGELCASIHSCYMRRVSEPEYSRLNFVVLGVATPEQLCIDPSVSPFSAGRNIALEDFTLDECYSFAAGLDGAEPVVRSLIQRVHGWTHGQPYLTQKLLRGIARKGCRPGDVDAVLHELLLAPGMLLKEPYLSHIRAMLTDGSARGRQALAMLARLLRGGELIYDPGSAAQSLLHLAGLVSSDDNGMLRFRNRIVEHVFDAGWPQASGWRRWQQQALVGAGATLAVALMVFWYARILPRPYIDTLTLVTNDYELALQAHERLRRLPGFGGRADDLLEALMVTRSASAASITEVRAADAVLRERLDRDALADRLMADYWVRLAERSAANGDREQALLQSIAGLDAGSPHAHALAVNLIDDDFVLLEQTVHFEDALADFVVDWDREQIIGVDSGQQLYRVPLIVASRNQAAAGAVSGRPVPLSITAPQQTGVTRGFFVDEPGRAGALQLRVTVEHPRPSDLLLRLRAPSGAAAEVGLPRRDGGLEEYVITASARNGLLRLADESITGQWELTVYDRLDGEAGQLLSWGLRFPDMPQPWDDDPIEGIDLPDSLVSAQVTISLSPDGYRAVAVPARADARGAASVWDLGTGARVVDLPLTDRADLLRFVSDDRLLIMGPLRASLWRVGDEEPMAEFMTDGAFMAPPAISPDRNFLALVEAIDDRARVTLVGVGDGRAIGSFDADAWRDWELSLDAEFLAVIDGSRRGRVISAETGEMLLDFFHDVELTRVLTARDRVIAVDAAGDIFAWDIDRDRRALSPRDSRFLGSSSDPDSVVVSSEGERLSYVDADGLVSVVRVSDGYRQVALGQGRGLPLRADFSVDGELVASAAGSMLRIWRLPAERTAATAIADVAMVALDPAGEFAVLGHRNGQVKLLRNLPASLQSGALPVGDYVGHLGVVTSLALAPDGELAASGGSDGLIRVWDTVTGSPSPYLQSHPSGAISALAFSRDRRWLLGAGPGSARVFELETGRLASEIEVDGRVLSVDFAPDGRSVAIGDTAGNIYLAAPDGSQGIVTIRGRSAVTALRFADLPEILASGNGDGDLIFWNTLETRAVGRAMSFPGPIGWISLSPDAADVRLRAGSWLYRLDRGAAEPEVLAARLLPAGLRNGAAIVSIGPSTVRGLANGGAGHLVLRDIEIAPVAAESLAGEPLPTAALPGSSDAALTGRDWSRLLGLEIDPESGDVRLRLR